jgi:hypothetical protein
MSFVSVARNWYKDSRDALMSSTGAFGRLPRFASTVKESTATTWKSGKLRVERGWQWLLSRQRVVSLVFGIGIAAAAFICFVVTGGASWYGKNYKAIAPLLTLAAGVAVAGVALARHFAQTNADRQIRITENFSKAIEQLGSDKLEVRLGGIYSLERISKESSDDYWPIMENLTAFVREHSSRSEMERTSQDLKQQMSRQDLEQRISLRAYFLWQRAGQPDGKENFFWSLATKLEELGEPPATDIAAVLAVIGRRSERSRGCEHNPANDWRLDLRRAALRRAELSNTHLERAIFIVRISKKPTSKGRISKPPIYAAHISKEPASWVRISKEPISKRRISKEPGSSARISKKPTSKGRISKSPIYATRISKEPISAMRISKEPA